MEKGLLQKGGGRFYRTEQGTQKLCLGLGEQEFIGVQDTCKETKRKSHQNKSPSEIPPTGSTQGSVLGLPKHFGHQCLLLSCETMCRSLHLFMAQFPYLSNEETRLHHLLGQIVKQ